MFSDISDGYITTLLSVLCVLVEIISRARAKGKKDLKDFKFDAFLKNILLVVFKVTARQAWQRKG